eukprot:TRINITY_DN2186_c0_g1_i1.p1 TRINITY_DN2186_c0_g1~~TRINITY_DN2186_c0_g1_i1.p1  ORF type:complete len:516 (-),score=110.14 TRINITY_DN2186_c0_g1_i1:34-1581(-)
MTSKKQNNVLPEVAKIESDLIAWRRHFHQYPETAFEEVNTASFIAERLRGLKNVEVVEKVGKTGVVGILRGTSLSSSISSPCVALRADMDALPIQEQVTSRNALYRSKVTGKSHACGHDFHMSMLLGAATVLSKKQDQLSGTVKFVFQPAEEGKGGARAMIQDGFLTDSKFGPKIDQMYGCHIWSAVDAGFVGIKTGPFMAASDRFVITVKGTGGHASQPDGTADSIVAACYLVCQLQSIVSRNIGPFDSAVVTVGQINGGYNYNVISDRAEIIGTVRTIHAKTRTLIQDRIQSICQGIGESFNVSVNCDYVLGYPPTINRSIYAVEEVSKAARAIVGNSSLGPIPSVMAAEDFAYFLEKIPISCFFFLGGNCVKGLSCFDTEVNLEHPASSCSAPKSLSSFNVIDSNKLSTTASASSSASSTTITSVSSSSSSLSTSFSTSSTSSSSSSTLSSTPQWIKQHATNFDCDEDTLAIGASIWVQLVVNLLGSTSNSTAAKSERNSNSLSSTKSKSST